MGITGHTLDRLGFHSSARSGRTRCRWRLRFSSVSRSAARNLTRLVEVIETGSASADGVGLTDVRAEKDFERAKRVPSQCEEAAIGLLIGFGAMCAVISALVPALTPHGTNVVEGTRLSLSLIFSMHSKGLMEHL